jgi:pimeloyl-ACP methyl ester carboxylesterase
MFDGLPGADSCSIPARIACPKLVIRGEDNRVIPTEEWRTMAAPVHSRRLVLFPDYGQRND